MAVREGRAPRALVTGASSGIGRAIAERLAADGARLVLLAALADAEPLGALAAALRTQHGTRVETLAADVGDAETQRAAVALAESAFGGLDWLASNAGIAFHEPAIEATLETFDHTFHVNVRGTYGLCLEASRAMVRAGGGAIVCTASSMGLLAEEGYPSYSASKGAVLALVRALALDLAPYGVRVNALSPGWVDTPATHAALRDAEQWSKSRSKVPFDRPGRPHEMASVVRFLLSEEATYMSGATVCADGGITAGQRYSDWEAVVRPLEPRAHRLLENEESD